MAHLRVTPLSCFSFLSIHVFHFVSLLFRKFLLFFILFFIFLKKKSVFFSFSFFFFQKYLIASISIRVSFVVGAPWRCGVLATRGGIARIGLGHPLGREHGSTHQSGVGAPRLLKRSLSRLYYCW